MTGIGGIINTPQGPAQVKAVIPGGGAGAPDRLVGTPLSQNAENCDSKPPGEKDLTDEERRRLKELQESDRAVKAEERRHAAVAGAYGGAPQYQYVRGPDGKYYAVGGKVDVAVPATADPEQAERAHKAVAAAARSVSTPSSADQRAEVQANQIAARAYAGTATRDHYRRGDYLDLGL